MAIHDQMPYSIYKYNALLNLSVIHLKMLYVSNWCIQLCRTLFHDYCQYWFRMNLLTRTWVAVAVLCLWCMAHAVVAAMLWYRVRARAVPPLVSATARDGTRVPSVPDRPVTMNWNKRFVQVPLFSILFCGSNHTKSWHDSRFVNILDVANSVGTYWRNAKLTYFSCDVI